jgi:hypothetical protein
MTIAECIYNCTTDGEVFNAWAKQSFVAQRWNLGRWSLWIMERFISIPERERPLRPPAVSWFSYLPTLQTINPIEKFWANLKGTLSHILHLFPSSLDAIQYAFLKWDDYNMLMYAAGGAVEETARMHRNVPISILRARHERHRKYFHLWNSPSNRVFLLLFYESFLEKKNRHLRFLSETFPFTEWR